MNMDVTRIIFTSTSSSLRDVIIRRLGSAQAQQSTASSAEAKESMSPMGCLRPSIPPLMLLDLRYQSVLPAALRSEVGAEESWVLFLSISYFQELQVQNEEREQEFTSRQSL